MTDFVRTGEDQWRSGACWNVARVASTLGVATGWGGSVGKDLFGDALMRRSAEAGRDLRFAQQVEQPPLLAMVHALDPPQYFFVGSADQGSTRRCCRTVGARPAGTRTSAASAWCASRWARACWRWLKSCMRAACGSASIPTAAT